MTRALNRIALAILIRMSENRIGRIAQVRAVDDAAAGYRNGMAILRSALGDEQIVPTIFFIKVRSLGIAAARSAPDFFRGRELLAGLRVDFAEGDVAVGIAHEVAFAIFEIERRVDAALLEPDGVRPFATGVGRVHDEVALSAYVRCNHIKGTLVVADSRSKDARAGIGMFETYLRFARQAIPDLLPMHQIPAMKQRDAREILKATVY